MRSMKILSASQIQRVDEYTIQHEPITSTDLMERAASGVLDMMMQMSFPEPYIVVCGRGNNGGDGLVMARLLHGMGKDVKVILPGFKEGGSPDFKINLKRLKKLPVGIEVINTGADISWPAGGTIVDALFGTGLSRPLDGEFKRLVQSMNNSGLPIVAVDVPSGLETDKTQCGDPEAVIRATHTFTFEVPKYAFLFPETGVFAGNFSLVPIGWHPDGIDAEESKIFYIQREDVLPLLKKRNTFAYKNTVGHLLVVGGSHAKMGAALLTSKAAFRVGAGMVTAHIPRSGVSAFNTALPDVMLLPDESETEITSVELKESYQAIAIGPGMGTDPVQSNALKRIIQDAGVPLILDADALNILAENPIWLAFLPPLSVLTPHYGEMRRLLKMSSFTLEDVTEFAVRHQVTVVLKGAFTATCTPLGKVYFNSSGTPALAVAGAGDVLTGCISGLMVQGYYPVEACLLGNYVHGLAARILSEEISMESVMAGDVAEALGMALNSLFNG
jgi:ADP-dependent NAD(P)H-hydrate dehydratase / NAD(P)H-hydrate epimerase